MCQMSFLQSMTKTVLTYMYLGKKGQIETEISDSSHDVIFFVALLKIIINAFNKIRICLKIIIQEMSSNSLMTMHAIQLTFFSESLNKNINL